MKVCSVCCVHTLQGYFSTKKHFIEVSDLFLNGTYFESVSDYHGKNLKKLSALQMSLNFYLA